MCSDSDIARILNEAGYRPRGRSGRALALFSKDTVTIMLQNRFYLGEVQYKGEWFEGLHEPIVSENVLERVQELRKRRRSGTGSKARNGSREYPLSGLVRCARYGWPMRGASSSGKRYYRDPARDHGRACDQRMVRASEAEEALGAFLQLLSLPDDWQARVLELIQEQAGRRLDIMREKTRIQGQLERLKRLFVLGDLAEQEYVAERDRLEARLATLIISPTMPNLERTAELLQDFGAIWSAATLRERKEIAHALLETVYLDSGQKGPIVAIQPRAEFASHFELAMEVGRETSSPQGGMTPHGEMTPVVPAVSWLASDRMWLRGSRLLQV